MACKKIKILIFLLLAAIPALVFANPEGEVVVSGTADFDRSTPDTLNVNTSSDKLIVNYNSFSIAQHETTNFHQPSASSIALNRVVGVDPSQIMGTLTANGRVFIVNPNGVIFGPNSHVDCAGLVASTMDIENSDFLNGNYNFYKKDGSRNSYVINQSRDFIIRNGGYVCLLSQAVENQGVIIADLGKVVLASGTKMTLALDDLNDISVTIDEGVSEAVFGPDGKKIDSAVKNSGEIYANGGKVILTAKVLNNAFDYAINNTGIIEAKSLVNHNGTVELVADGAPILNIGKIEAGQINIRALNTDFINKGQVISPKIEGLPASGLIYIKTINLTQDGLIAAIGGTVTVEAETIKTTMAVAPGTDPATLALLVIRANQVNILSRSVGSTGFPIAIDAPNIYFNRTAGNIDILESIGIGSSILLRGPPDGFGEIIYNRDANLELDAAKVTLVGSNPTYLYGNIIFHNFECTTPDKEIYFEAGKTFTFKDSLNIIGAPDVGAEEYYIKLRSQEAGSSWYLNIETSNYNLERVNISDCYSQTLVVIPIGVNAGNNFNLDIDPVWDGGGSTINWSDGDNWDGNVVPTGSDEVRFNATSSNDCFINNVGSWSGGNFIIEAGYTGHITQNVNITVGNFEQAGGQFNPNGKTFTVNGNFTYTSGTFVASGTVKFNASLGTTQQLTSNGLVFKNLTHSGTGTLQLIDSLHVDGIFANSSGTFDANNQNMTFSGNWNNTSSAIFTRGSGSLTFDDITTLVNSSSNAGDLGAVTITGTLTLGSNAKMTSVSGAGTLNMGTSRTLTLTGTGTPLTVSTFDKGTNSTVIYTGSGAITYIANVIYNNLTLSPTSSTVYMLLGHQTVGNNLVINNNATLDADNINNYNMAAKNITINAGGTYLARNSTITLSGNWSKSATGTFDAGTSTVVFNGTGAQSISGANTWYNLTIDNSAEPPSNTLDVDPSSAQTVTNNLTVNDGQWTPRSGDKYNNVIINTFGTIKPDSGATFYVSGNWTRIGTFTHNNGTVVFNGTGAQIITGTNTWYNLTINNTAPVPGDAVDVEADSIQTVQNNLTITDGQWTPQDGDIYKNVSIQTNGILKPVALANIYVSGNWANSGTFTHNSGTVTFDGTGTQTLNSGGITASKEFNDIVYSGTGTLKLSTNNVIVNGNLTVSSGIFNPNGRKITGNGVANILDVTGTILVDATTFLGNYVGFETRTLNTGSTVNYSRNGSQTIDSSLDYYTLTTSGSGTKKLDGNTDVFNLTVGAETTLNPNNFCITGDSIAGFADIWGTLLVDATTFDGNYTGFNNGAFETGSTVNYSRNGDQTIDGDKSPYYNLITSGSGIKKIDDDTTVNGNLTIGSGTTLDVDIISNYGLTVGGNWTNNGTFNARNGTVTFNGGDATIDVNGTETFWNLVFDSTGTKTISSGDILITTGTLTLTNGIVNTGTLEAQGNVVVDSGFDGGDSPLKFTGGAAQTFNLTGATNLFDGDITIAKTAGTLTLLSDLVMDYGSQDLTVTSGTFNVGDNYLFIEDTLTINGGTLTQGNQEINSANLIFQSGIFNQGSGKIDTNYFTQSGGTFNGGSGEIEIDNDFTLSDGIFTSTSGTLSVAGNWTKTGGTFAHNNGTVNFIGGWGVTQELTPGGSSFYDLVHSGVETLKLLGVLSVNNDFTNLNGTYDVNGFTTTVTGSFVNSALVTTSIGDIDITAGDMTTGDIDSNDGDIKLTTTVGDILVGLVDAGTGDVTLDSAGAITDDNSDAAGDNIVADELILTAATGIGSGNALETRVNKLDAKNTDNNIEISNDGDLILEDLNSDSYAVRILTSGDINIVAASPLDVNSAVVAPGDITLQATDDGGDNDDLTIAANIQSTGSGMIRLSAGHDVLLNSGTISTGGVVDINADQDGSGSGGVTQLAGNNIIADKLRVTSSDSASLTSSANNVNTLAAILHNLGASFTYNDTNTLTIGSVLVTDGIETNSGNVTLNTGNAITINNEIKAGTGTLTLNPSAGGVTQSARIIAANLLLRGAGTFTLNDSGNDVGTIAADVTGAINYRDANDLIVGSVGGVDGITTSGNDVTLNTGNNLTLSQLINAGAGDVTLNAGAGSITDGNAGANNITADLLTATAATGIDLDTTINSLDASVLGAGSLIIRETDAIDLVDVDTANGPITVTAGGLVTATDVRSLTDADANDISLTGVGIVAGLISAGTTAGDVTLNAGAGSITDGNAGANNITADLLTATAATGIDLDTTINSLDASVLGAGSLIIRETDAIDLVDVDTANGPITVTAGGLVTATDVRSLTDADANDISLTGVGIEVDAINAGTQGDVTLDATTGAITDSGTNSMITADQLSFSAGANVGTAAKPINTTVEEILSGTAAGNIYLNEFDAITLTSLITSTGKINVEAGNKITAVSVVNNGGFNGDDIILKTNSGNIEVGTITANGLGDVTLDAFGAITDSNGATVNVTADDLVATAATGINLDTQVAKLKADNTTSGKIDIANTGDLEVRTVTNDNRDVTLSSTGAITNDDPGGASDIKAGDFFVTAVNGIDLDTTVKTLNAHVTATGDININETNAITLTDVDTANGLITINAGGTITAVDVDSSATDNDLNDIKLTTTAGDIEVGTINAGSAGDVELTAAGAITDNDANSLITADDFSFIAGTNVGSLANRINTTVTRLLSGTAAGNIYLKETDAIILASLTISTGIIDVEAGNTITAQSVINNGGTDTDDIILTTTAGDIEVDTITATGDGDVDLTAAGSITDNDGNSLITADQLSFIAGLNVGTSLRRINTKVNEILAGTATTGNIYLEEQDGATFTNLFAGGLIDLLAHATSTAGHIEADGSVTIRLTNGDLTILTGTVQSNSSWVNILLDNGSLYATGDGPHVVANGGDSYISTPNGTITAIGQALYVIINGHLILNIGAKVSGVSGRLNGLISDGGFRIPLFVPSSYPFHLYPPGKVFYNGRMIWPSIFTYLLSQSYQALNNNPYLPDSEQFKIYQYNTADTRLVLFYHPLTEYDMAAFDQFNLGEDAYEFINGQVNILGHDGLLPILEEIKKKKKKNTT